jgi:cytochrome c oxidase subunit 3
MTQTSTEGWTLPSAGRAGMWALIAAESAIFVIFVVAYAFYLGKSVGGPTPSVLHAPIFLSVCLLSSSATMELAIVGMRRGKSAWFALGWIATWVLGAIFRTTFYSLVGLHALHVAVGLVLLGAVVVFIALGKVRREHLGKLEVLSLYWHFVDSVWVVVFMLVYVVGR